MSDILFNLLDSRDQGGDASFFDTNVFTPAANQTIILATSGLKVGVPPPAPVAPSLSGNGVTWSLIASQLFDWAGTDRGILSVYRGLASSPTTGVTRVQYGSTQLRQAIVTFQYTQTDIGNLGANSIVGTPVQKRIANGAGDLNPSLTLPAGENIANPVIGILAGGDGPNIGVVNPGFGFIETIRLNHSEGGLQHQIFSQFVLTTVDWIIQFDPALALIAFELRNANPFVAGVSPAVGGSAFIAGNLIT